MTRHMIELIRFYWRFEKKFLFFIILFYLAFLTLMMGMFDNMQPLTDFFGLIDGTLSDEQLIGSTQNVWNWIFVYPGFLWAGNSFSAFSIFSMHKENWLLPASLKEKFVSRILFSFCFCVASIIILTFWVDWIRQPLAWLLSVEKPFEKGWALPLLALHFKWYTVAFYLWFLTFCYYLSARYNRLRWQVVFPFMLIAIYENLLFYGIFHGFDVWLPYLGILFLIGTPFNVIWAYRRFKKLEIELHPIPKLK